MNHADTSTGPLRGESAWRIAGIGLVVIAVVGGGLAVVVTRSSDRVAPELAAGKALFEANCMECHGAGALGDGPLAASLPVDPPSILEHLGHHSENQLVQLIRSGVPPGMPPAPLSEDEVRQVIAYAWSLVPEADRAGLRAMQEHMAQMEEMGISMPMPGMEMSPSADSTSGGAARQPH